MDKKILIGLSFSVIFLFVITGCSQGQAVKIPTANNAQLAQPQLTCQNTGCKFQCQSFSNVDDGEAGDTMDVVCQRRGYNQCVDVTYFGRTQIASGNYWAFSMPGHCELSPREEGDSVNQFLAGGGDDFGGLSSVNILVNCCKIS